MAIRILETKDFKWINIDNFDVTAANFLKKNFHFHPLDLQDCFNDNPHPKVDSYSSYLFIVLNVPEFVEEHNEIFSHELDIFLGKDFLITVQKKEFKSLKKLYYKFAKDSRIRDNFFGKKTAFLLYNILQELFYSFKYLTNHFRKTINSLEKKIYEKNLTTKTIKELAIVDIQVVNAISIIEPQRFTINTLVNTGSIIMPREFNIYYDDIHDRIEEMSTILKNYDNIISSLQNTTESLISTRTNVVMKILAVISVALMPLNLLAGIYGMNVDNLPGAHHPVIVWTVFSALFLVILSTLYLLKRKNWL